MGTREKLIDLLTEIDGICPNEENCYHCKYDNEEYCFAHSKADFLIANGVTVQQWIPVTERLPEENEIVVGWCKDNPFSSYTFEIVSWNGKGWVFVYAQRYVTNVTHWMPLPEKPKEIDYGTLDN